MIKLPTLIGGLLSAGTDRSKYWSLVDRIGDRLRSSSGLRDGLAAAAHEIGSAFNAARSAVFLTSDHKIKLSADYNSPGLPTSLKEPLVRIENQIALHPEAFSTLTEIAESDSTSPVGSHLRSVLRDCSQTNVLRSLLIAPLIIDSRVIGAIALYRKSRRWSTDEKHCARALVSSVSQWIDQNQAAERARSAADREALTNQLLTAIRSAVGVDELLGVAVEGIGSALGVGRAAIYMDADKNGNKKGERTSPPSLIARAEYRESPATASVLGSEFDIQRTPLLGQLLEGDIVAVPDTNDDHPIVRAIGVRLGVRSMVFAPVAYNGQTVAVLALEQHDRLRSFSAAELGMIRLVTEQTAVALYQARLYREAEDAARRDALISRITSAIHSTLDSDAVLQAIVNELGEALSVCRCRLAVLPNPMPEHIPITHEYTAPCCAERPPMMQAIPVAGNQHLQSLLSNNRALATDDVTRDPRFDPNRSRLEAGRVKSVLAIAIRLGGRPIGVFSLHHCEEHHSWTQWEIDVVQSVTEQAAVAIRQAELYRDARESATRAALVNQIVASIRRSLDLKETLQVAVEELGRALGANRTSFRKVAGDKLVVVAEHLSTPGLSVRDVNESRSSYVTNYLIETKRTMVLDDVPAFATAHAQVAATVALWHVEPPNQSEIISPIFVNDQLWGSLSIAQTDHFRRWTANDIALVEVVTAQVEVAVSHSRLFEEARRSAKREALVSRIIHGINQTNRIDEIVPVVAPALGQHLAVDRLVILTFDDKEGLVTVDCDYSDGHLRLPGSVFHTSHFSSIEALVQGDSLVSSDVEADPRFKSQLEGFWRPIGARSFLAVNLRDERRPHIAVVGLMNSRPRIWTDDEVEIVRAAANQICIGLHRAELFEQISQGKYQWEATFDALRDGIFIFDEHGVLRRVNQAAAAFEGAQAHQLIGRRCCTLLQGIEGETCRVAEVMRSGRPVTFELMPELLSRPVLVTMSPLTDAQGRLFSLGDGSRRRSGPLNVAPGAVCIVRDLSELRAAEAVAREQRSFLIKLIEHANDAIFALSPEGQFIWFNEQLVTLSGYSREEIFGTDYRQFIPTEDKRLAVETFTRALAGQAQTAEIHGVRKGGETRLLLITYTPIYDEGRVTSVLSIARDITEERRASERAAQADKLRALGQLASGVAHNFNNVLAAVLGHAQLIKRDCTDERILGRVHVIEQAALDGAQTVKRIQGFGPQQNESAVDAVDINRLVEDSTNLTEARWCDDAQARGLYYDVETDLQDVPMVSGSASDIREVFVNIILNALDAMPGGGRLRITTESNGQTVKTQFADDGMGMSREICERIFEPFFTTKGAAGTGLGLSVSYSIIERHGGIIEAFSDPGQGSIFTVTLPVRTCSAEPSTGTGSKNVASSNILVVDDDDRVREALAGILTQAGHRVQQAAGGRDGLSLIEANNFSVVITDLSMPEMDGWAVASEIRRRWPEIKIVLITGFALDADTISSNSGLVDSVVFKPIRMDDFCATISDILSDSESSVLALASGNPRTTIH